MKKFILKRLIHFFIILVGITFLSFMMIKLAGSDVIVQRYENMGIVLSQEVIDAYRNELGLNQPLINQYFSWVIKLLQGNMGVSYVSGNDVFTTVISKLPATILLSICSIILTIIISIPLGIVSAVKQNQLIDNFIRIFSFIGNSMPNFFVALLLMYFFSIKLKILPVISNSLSVNSLILPTLTLAIAMSSKYIRQVRATILDELNKDYVLSAKARGVKFSTILFKNVLRSSLTTIITLLSLSIGSLLGGSAIVESIYMFDGIGKLAVDAINMRDYPMIQAYVMWMAFIYVFINLVSDILYHVIDPRIRIGSDVNEKK